MVTRLPDEAEVVSPQQLPEPVVPLEYAPPPQQQRNLRHDVWLGTVICVAFSVGVGLFAYGMMLSSGWRDDQATPAAMGVTFMVLGAALTGLLLWIRRKPTPPRA